MKTVIRILIQHDIGFVLLWTRLISDDQRLKFCVHVADMQFKSGTVFLPSFIYG